MYPGSSPLSPSPYAFSYVASSTNFLSFLLVPGRGGRGGALLRLVAFYFPIPSPPRAPCSVSPICTRAASSPSASPLLPMASPASFADRPVGSGERRWLTAPDTDRTRSCGRTDGRRNTRSCKTTGTRIHRRRRRHDKPVVLVTWCLPPAPSPSPSPLTTLLT